MSARSTFAILASVVAQLLVFVALGFSYPTLLWVSAWVVKVPVAILGALALVTPVMFRASGNDGTYLFSLARKGWLFVAAAALWVSCYWWMSEREGTPVSYDAMKARYER